MSLRQLEAPAPHGMRKESFGSDASDEEKTKIQPTSSTSTAAAAPSLVRRASSKRWYSDSDDEGGGGGGGENNCANNQAGSMSSLQASSVASAASSSASALHRRASASAFLPSPSGSVGTGKAPPPPALALTSPTGPPINPVDKQRPGSVSGFQKLMQKTKVMSPFRSKHSRQLKEEAVPPVNQPHENPSAAHRPSSLDCAVSPPSMASATPAATGGASLQRRHSSRMTLRASSSEVSLAPTPEDEPDDAFQQNVLDALSPGRGALGGAVAGVPGSGVLLEGWLRQKQRRGIRGLKSWNSRYFVLFKNPNEMRYYTDVVQSGWGPIPLGELGCISLRSIQRISKPSHPKYKGCRFDITCRLPSAAIASAAGDYDDGLFSSGDDDKKEKPAAKTTPKAATREFCLVSDSPQTTVTWVAMLDSLLTRSVNSPRPDTVNGRRSSSSNLSAASGGGGSLKALVTQNIRQKAVLGGLGVAAPSSTTPSSSSVPHQMSPNAATTPGTPSNAVTVFTLPQDIVPKAIVLAIEYIFESFPGIETERFYTADPPPPARLQTVVSFFNMFAVEKRKPTRNEWEDVLDVVTAGAVVMLWLEQLDGPIVPVDMYHDFRHVMVEGAHAPFELLRNLKGLLATLPPKPLKMVAFLIFHWNDVTVYEAKNKLTAPVLAQLFTRFVFRKQVELQDDDHDREERDLMRSIVEYMITHADVLIDEKEAELLE